MQFKYPEILYFLFLLIIPILVHLFQLRRFKKQYFTNVRLLKTLSIETRKSSQIKKWLLLITRILIYTFLILAFAQPFFEGKDSKSSNNEMYLILDNSYSMQAKGKNGPLLKRAIEDLLEHTPENQKFSLITNTQTFWNTDIKSIRKDLQNLKYSATPFQLESAISKIKARKSIFNKDVVIITDGVGLKEKQLKSISKEINAKFIIPESEQKNNIAIDSIFIHQNLNDFYEIGVQLSAYGSKFKEVPIALYNFNKLIAKTQLKFDTSKKTVFFTIPKKEYHAYVTITENGLAYDNTLFFSITNPEKINVISLGSNEKSNFLRRIYFKNEFNYNNFSLENLDYNILEKQDVILLNELEEIPQSLQTSLSAFTSRGGNLIFIPSNKCSLQNTNLFITKFGKIQFKALQNNEKLITKIAFNNPLYQAVFDKKVTNFQYPKTISNFIIDSSTPAILSYEDQNIFLTSLQNQLSTVYIFAAELNKVNSNFQNSPLIVPTFYNMARRIEKTGVSAMKIGADNMFLINELLSKDEILNIKENNNSFNENFIPVQQILNNKVKINCNNNPENAGNFGVYKKNKLIKNISFNYDRVESDITQNRSDFVAELNVNSNIETVFDLIKTERTDTELWKWFALLTLLLLITELFIQKFVK